MFLLIFERISHIFGSALVWFKSLFWLTFGAFPTHSMYCDNQFDFFSWSQQPIAISQNHQTYPETLILDFSPRKLEWSWPRQGLLNRWTSQYDWGITAGGLTFNLNNGTKSHLIIVKLLENTFLGMTKVRDWPILTLAMPSVKTEQIQNFALF